MSKIYLKKEHFDAVIHFAALIVVPHSMQHPYSYFNHNVNTSLNLLEAMRLSETKNIVFSSTCAVYGSPQKLPLTETESIKPENVYAETKVMIEKAIQWYSKIYHMNYAILRYFNACGASEDGVHGENHIPETHMIPCSIKSILDGKPITIYGNDYPTPDGTNIRDYVHVSDLASAHHLALQYIIEKQTSDIFNLGTGNGCSTLTVAKTVVEEAKKHGIEASYAFAPRRPGDSTSLYADNTKAKTVLGWNPEYTDIARIVAEAYKWRSAYHREYF